MLLGNNIRLRPLQNGDETLFFRWRNDLEYIGLTRSFRLPKHQSVEQEWLESVMNDKSNKNIYFIIETIADSNAVGFVQLSTIDWISRNCMFGIAIPEKNFRGKGFGKEVMKLLFDYVFNFLNLKKIALEVISFNANSIHLYEKLGFKKEGELKQHYFWNGSYHDVLIYGLFKENFVKDESE